MIGVLLVNLGTPKTPKTKDVRIYLREFLQDPRVIDINPLARWILVNLIIVPFRAPKSAAKYQLIWTEQGSPLLLHTEALGRAVQEALGSDYAVEVAMRYGEPSISSKLEKLQRKNVSEIRALPLYPQYASSSTGSTEAAILKYIRHRPNMPEVKFIPPFFDHPGFLQSFVEVGKAPLAKAHPDHIIFSFHGLPERHILKEDIGGKHCLKSPDCCDRIVPSNGMCYRAHCFQTARGIAEGLGLKKDDFSISFQSRLGRTPWIQPFTDHLIKDLARQGKKRIAVFCPSFIADCLETLEEVALGFRKSFKELGGEELILIPSLNAHPTWVETVQKMIQG